MTISNSSFAPDARLWLAIGVVAIATLHASSMVLAEEEMQPAATLTPSSSALTYSGYNSPLRTQLSNLWAFVEQASITRGIWRTLKENKSLESARIASTPTTAAGRLISILSQINIGLREKPSGKLFVISANSYANLLSFVTDGTVDGLTDHKESTLNRLIEKIETKSGQSMKNVILNESRATSRERSKAVKISSATPSGTSTTTEKSRSTDKATIEKRYREDAQFAAASWQDQLLRQTLAGAMAGAGLEMVITVSYKTFVDGRPPWVWEDADTAEVAWATGSGAAFGALGTAATWTLNHRYPSLPLWMTSATVTSSMHLIRESLKMMVHQDDAPTFTELGKSLPATLVMSIGAYIGEQMSPLPLVGAVLGAISGRIAIGAIDTYLQEHINQIPNPPRIQNIQGTVLP